MTTKLNKIKASLRASGGGRGGSAPYRKGREFENRVKKHLEQQGWFVVRAV